MKILKIINIILITISILIVFTIVTKAIISTLEMIALRNFIWEIMAHEIQLI